MAKFLLWSTNCNLYFLFWSDNYPYKAVHCTDEIITLNACEEELCSAYQLLFDAYSNAMYMELNLIDLKMAHLSVLENLRFGAFFLQIHIFKNK